MRESIQPFCDEINEVSKPARCPNINAQNVQDPKPSGDSQNRGNNSDVAVYVSHANLQTRISRPWASGLVERTRSPVATNRLSLKIAP